MPALESMTGIKGDSRRRIPKEGAEMRCDIEVGGIISRNSLGIVQVGWQRP